jgi:hypothetical protein
MAVGTGRVASGSTTVESPVTGYGMTFGEAGFFASPPVMRYRAWNR